jgi:hypothetical protein
MDAVAMLNMLLSSFTCTGAGPASAWLTDGELVRWSPQATSAARSAAWSYPAPASSRARVLAVAMSPILRADWAASSLICEAGGDREPWWMAETGHHACWISKVVTPTCPTGLLHLKRLTRCTARMTVTPVSTPKPSLPPQTCTPPASPPPGSLPGPAAQPPRSPHPAGGAVPPHDQLTAGAGAGRSDPHRRPLHWTLHITSTCCCEPLVFGMAQPQQTCLTQSWCQPVAPCS